MMRRRGSPWLFHLWAVFSSASEWFLLVPLLPFPRSRRLSAQEIAFLLNCDLVIVYCHARLLGSSCRPCALSTLLSTRVPHRSDRLLQSWASAARAKPELSANRGLARAGRHP